MTFSTSFHRTIQVLAFVAVTSLSLSGCQDSLLAAETTDATAQAEATELVQATPDKLRDADLLNQATSTEAAGKATIVSLIVTVSADAALDQVAQRYAMAQRKFVQRYDLQAQQQRKFVQRYDLSTGSFVLNVDAASLETVLDELAEDADVLWIAPDVDKRTDNPPGL